MNAAELQRIADDRVVSMNNGRRCEDQRQNARGAIICCNYEGTPDMMPYNVRVSASMRKDIKIEIDRITKEREENPPAPTESGPDKVSRLATERINKIRARDQVKTMVDVTTDTPMKLSKEFA